MSFFERIYDGSEPNEHVLAYLKGQPTGGQTAADHPETTIARIQWKAPYPIIRHHFGLPTMKATRQGIVEIAKTQVLDVISLGIDQDAQANFFHPDRQDPRRRAPVAYRFAAPRIINRCMRLVGAATIRSCGPIPTDDFIRLAKMYIDTINIAPHIVHVVGYTEADHAATADDVIESCNLARRAIENALRGAPDMTVIPTCRPSADWCSRPRSPWPPFTALAPIADRDVGDPLIDPATLARAVELGILDAPQLRSNRFARGEAITRITTASVCVS